MSRRTLTRAPNPHAAPPVSAATRRDLFGTMGALLQPFAGNAGGSVLALSDGSQVTFSNVSATALQQAVRTV